MSGGACRAASVNSSRRAELHCLIFLKPLHLRDEYFEKTNSIFIAFFVFVKYWNFYECRTHTVHLKT